jgi:hypothetical protein
MVRDEENFNVFREIFDFDRYLGSFPEEQLPFYNEFVET